MRNQRTIQERLEQQVFCFGGDGGGGGGGGSASPDPTRQAGRNTRVDSRGNTVNFNTGPATTGMGTQEQRANYTKTLPNGVQVVDFSQDFGGQVNLSNQASPLGGGMFGLGRGMFGNMPDPGASMPTPPGGMFGNLPDPNVKNPEALAPVTGTTSINPENFVGQAPLGMDTSFGAFGRQVNDFNRATAPTTPAQALQEALASGRVNLGSGFYAGRTPSGLGLGFETTFAQGGPVTGGIASLVKRG